MRCPQCSREYTTATAFCTYCGVALVASQAPRVATAAPRAPIAPAPAAPSPAAPSPAAPAALAQPQQSAAVAPYAAPIAAPARYVPTAPSNSTVNPAVNAGAPMSSAAIASLVVDFFFAPVGIVLGHIALRTIARDKLRGRGVAIAGVVVGYVLLPFHLFNWGIAIYSVFQ